MSDTVYGNVIGTETEGFNRERMEINIYENADCVSDHDFMAETNTHQSTGSDCVNNRSSRAAVVCLVLLCVLLLTAVIVLCVYIHTNNTNYTQEKDELRTNITNLTEERNELRTNITNLTEERDELRTNITNHTKERNELRTNITNLTEERDELRTNITNLTEERNQPLTNITNLTEERDELGTNITNHTEREQLLATIKALQDQLAIKNKDYADENKNLLTKNVNLMKQTEQLNQEKNDLRKRLNEMEKWKCYQSNFYYLSSEKKSWTESRRYCKERGADLISINNREEQEFVTKWSNTIRVWIGLTDSDVEGRWKWVDGSTPNFGLWMNAEPNGERQENCGLTVVGEWADHPCTDQFNWMCERSTV